MARSNAGNEEGSKVVHGLLQVVNPNPTAAVVSAHGQHDLALAEAAYVAGEHIVQVSPALPKRPAAQCDSGGTTKFFVVLLLPTVAPPQRDQAAVLYI